MENSTLSEAQKRECDRLRAYRIRLSKTQEQFSEVAGVAIATIKNIERYKTPVTGRTKSIVGDYLLSQDIIPSWKDNEELDELYEVVNKYMIRGAIPSEIGKVRDCLHEILSCDSFKRDSDRRQYIEFLTATLQQYKDLCVAEKNSLQRNERNELKQELDLLSRTAKSVSRRIYDANNHKD